MEEVTLSPEELDPKDKRKFWEDHIQAWHESGLTQAEYCRQNNLKNHRWWYWRKHVDRRRNPSGQRYWRGDCDCGAYRRSDDRWGWHYVSVD